MSREILDLLPSSCYIFCLRVTTVKIHLPSYPRGVHHIKEELSATDLNLDPAQFGSPIFADITLDRHDPYLEFDLNIQSKVTTQCDRCLVDFDWQLSTSSPMLFVLGRTPSGEAVDDPEICYLPAKATEVDLTGDIRDLILLALPGKYLCREDCRGLCPMCGVDWNVQECDHVPVSI